MNEIGSRFAGIPVSGVEKQWDNDIRRNREQETWQYEQARMARSDAQGRRAEEEAVQQHAAFAKARSDVESRDAGSPGAVAYGYASRMAEIKNLVRLDKLEEANSRMQELRDAADRHGTVFMTFASTNPDTPFEKAVNAGGFAMSSGAFWNEPMTMSNGMQMTAGDLFRDGKSFRSYRSDRLRQTDFTPRFVSAYENSSGFERNVLDRISDPVMNQQPGTANPLQSQYVDVGDYVVREWNGLVNELGEGGVQALVTDVLNRRMSSGTAMDTIQNVRRWVSAQRNDPSSSELDGRDLVRKGIGQFDHMLKSATGGKEATEPQQRLVSKMISAAVESGYVDFDDPVVRDRMDAMYGVFARADRMGIPLLVSGNENGTNMRAAMSDFVRGPSESNFLRRVDSMMDLTGTVLQSGWTVPQGGTVPTSGNRTVDAITDGMQSELARMCVPQMGSGKREDLALATCLNSPSARAELTDRWADQLTVAGGLPSGTARRMAEIAVEEMTSGGGVRPISMKDVIVRYASDRNADPKVKSDLMKWYKGTEMASDLLDRYRAPYMEMLMDRDVGFGLSDKAAVGRWASLMTQAGTYMSRGIDPTEAILATVNSFPVYSPTGDYSTPDGSVSVGENEYASLADAFAGGRSRVKTRGGRDIDIDTFRSLRPQVVRTQTSVDLRKTPVRGLRGVSNGFGPGAFSDPRQRDAFLQYQRDLKRIRDANALLGVEAVKSASRRAAESEE